MVEASPELVSKTAETPVMKDLVRLSEAFSRASIHGPFRAQLPVFCAMSIEGKGFRRGQVKEGHPFASESIRLGKKQGLIFVLKPATKLERNGEDVAAIELAWDDIINHFLPLAERIDESLGEDSNAFAKRIDAKLIEALERKPELYDVLSQGFERAQKDHREIAITGQLETLPGFGSF